MRTNHYRSPQIDIVSIIDNAKIGNIYLPEGLGEGFLEIEGRDLGGMAP